MYSATTEYVTKDLYLEFAGIDLDLELKDSNYDNPTLKSKIFLGNVQKWLYKYMTYRFETSQYETDWDDDVFTEALLWQVKYILKFGEDDNLAPMAYKVLRNSAMANRKRIGV